MYREYFPKEKSFIINILNLFNNKKPASREEFLLGMSFSFIYGAIFLHITLLTFIVMISIDEEGFLPIYLITGILLFISLIPVYIITYRRLLDIDESFIWLLLIIPLYFVPVLNVFILSYFLLKKGKPNTKYGPRNILGEAIFYKYFIKDEPLFPQIKEFYMQNKGRLNRLPYFWGILFIQILVNMVEKIFIFFIVITDSIFHYFKNIFLVLDSENTDFFTDLGLLDMGGYVFIFLIILYMVFFLITLYLQNNLNVRRIHDLNYSGYYLILYYLLWVIPYLNILAIVFLLLLLFKKGTTKENKYGQNVV